VVPNASQLPLQEMLFPELANMLYYGKMDNLWGYNQLGCTDTSERHKPRIGQKPRIESTNKNDVYLKIQAIEQLCCIKIRIPNYFTPAVQMIDD
jgi:hypothetical protein